MTGNITYNWCVIYASFVAYVNVATTFTNCTNAQIVNFSSGSGSVSGIVGMANTAVTINNCTVTCTMYVQNGNNNY